MWLVTLCVRLSWPLVMISVVVLLMGVGVVLGGMSALLAGGLVGLLLEGVARWILAGALGILIFILTLAVPLVFLVGLREVFLSSTWTLTYRELRPLTKLAPRQLPELGASGLEAAPVVQ
jgi:hypothetical protein